MTVQDQIRLWELERNRIKTQEGKLGILLEPFNAFESFIIFDLLLTWVQVSYTPRSHRKPTMNTSSTTHESLMSCCGRTQRSAASLVVSRAMRIFVDLSSDVLVAVMVGRWVVRIKGAKGGAVQRCAVACGSVRVRAAQRRKSCNCVYVSSWLKYLVDVGEYQGTILDQLNSG